MLSSKPSHKLPATSFTPLFTFNFTLPTITAQSQTSLPFSTSWGHAMVFVKRPAERSMRRSAKAAWGLYGMRMGN